MKPPPRKRMGNSRGPFRDQISEATAWQEGTKLRVPQTACSPLSLLHAPWTGPEPLRATKCRFFFLFSWLQVSVYYVITSSFCKLASWEDGPGRDTLAGGRGARPAASLAKAPGHRPLLPPQQGHGPPRGPPGPSGSLSVCGRNERSSAYPSLGLSRRIAFLENTLPVDAQPSCFARLYCKDFYFPPLQILDLLVTETLGPIGKWKGHLYNRTKALLLGLV